MSDDYTWELQRDELYFLTKIPFSYVREKKGKCSYDGTNESRVCVI